MSKLEILRPIREFRVIPIVRADSAEKAVKAAAAIFRGGIPILEVTMTVPGAMHVLEKVADEFGDQLVLGAGTVLDPETARQCMLAGAQFFVTPSLNRETIEMCNRYSKPVMPGALTPTEIVAAWEAGADMVKVFPVGTIGGPKYIKAIKAPLPHIQLAPTGGVSLENVAAYFAAGADAVAVGSDLCSTSAMAADEYERIEANARKFLEAARAVRED